MQVPSELALTRPRILRRYQIVIAMIVIGLILLVIFVQALANAYTNYLWYRSIDLTMVWRSMVETKLGLGIVFAGSFFLACWASLFAVDAVSARTPPQVSSYDVVTHYQTSLVRYRVTIRTVLSLLLSLAVGASASGQWQHWLLFENERTFPSRDAQFHRNVGFFVFRLPFLSFLVDWGLVALLVLLIVTSVGYYLNGSLRLAGRASSIEPGAISHLSLILAAMALVRAAGYVFVDRFALDLSHDGFVDGAGYTDVHVRLPAMSILAIVSMIAFVLLAYNLYRKSVSLPIVAVGLWAFIALLIGVIFPAFVQWLEVNPSQSRLELPYIERNITATRAAFGLSGISAQAFAGNNDVRASDVDADKATFDALPLWDPGTAAQVFNAVENDRSYYQVSGVSTDRYDLGTGSNKVETPVVIGTRELNQSGVPGGGSWVISHLEYTHGYGVVVSPANQVNGQTGQPVFDDSNIPVGSGAPLLKVTQPDIYFGATPSQYVIGDTKQPELDYATKGRQVTTHYSGSGGVQLSGFWQRAAYAIRFHDPNILDSNLITAKSRMIYYQQVTERVQKAAPFLQVDNNPYPVISDGSIYWIVDCYTTSDNYPYSEEAATGALPPGSPLGGQYNYVRNSVKAVVNAYTGHVSFFAVDPSDPILQSWMRAYPGMIEPMQDMAKLSSALPQHLRYPQDLLTVIASMYGRYRFTASQAQNFYSGENFWQVAAGNLGTPATPNYELLRLPGRSSLSFVAVEPMVPASASGSTQLLTSFLTAASGPSDYGSITAFELPKVTDNALGPELVASKLQRVNSIAQKVTLLDQHNSRVELGATLLVPVDDSLVWVQPLFVTSTGQAFPALEYVLVDFGGSQVGFSQTLSGALSSVFGSQVVGIADSSESVLRQISQDLSAAYQQYQAAIADGHAFKLGPLESALQALGLDLSQAHQLITSQHLGNLPATKSNSSSSSSSGVTTLPGSSGVSNGGNPPATTNSPPSGLTQPSDAG